MCGPLAVPAITAAVGVAGQYMSGSAQEAAATKQARVQSQEASAQSTQALGERMRAARAERARMTVAAGEAGVGGGSFRDALATQSLATGRDVATHKLQARNTGRSINASLASNIAAAGKPTLLSAGLQIGGAAATGYAGRPRK